MNKSLRPPPKNADFQKLACYCISQIPLLRHTFFLFIVLHLAPISTSVHISWLIFLLLTDFLRCFKWVKKVIKRGSEGPDSCPTWAKPI